MARIDKYSFIVPDPIKFYIAREKILAINTRIFNLDLVGIKTER